ncbi:hypothetical protein, partial [Streptomyces sp. NRRL F-3273]|uniref:hypothetical protein n=1 Tax=Streptomyces sp. NRRL F-3273 TaxID=1463848 RepID=UPI003B63F3B6
MPPARGKSLRPRTTGIEGSSAAGAGTLPGHQRGLCPYTSAERTTRSLTAAYAGVRVLSFVPPPEGWGASLGG